MFLVLITLVALALTVTRPEPLGFWSILFLSWKAGEKFFSSNS